jgi:hypothetical protein
MTAAPALRWTPRRRTGARGLPGGYQYHSDAGSYSVYPVYARDRRGRTLRSVVWRLYEGNRPVGMPFHSLWLAKRYAAELRAALQLPQDEARRRRRHLLHAGGQLCAQWERERRERERERRDGVA